MPSGQVVTLACTLGQSLEQLKQHFSAELKMPANVIMLMFDGKLYFNPLYTNGFFLLSGLIH